jgi:hypothetical protein
MLKTAMLLPKNMKIVRIRMESTVLSIVSEANINVFGA